MILPAACHSKGPSPLAEVATTMALDPGLRTQAHPMDPVVLPGLVGAQHTLLYCQMHSQGSRDSQRPSHVTHQSRAPHSSLATASSEGIGSASPLHRKVGTLVLCVWAQLVLPSLVRLKHNNPALSEPHRESGDSLLYRVKSGR